MGHASKRGKSVPGLLSKRLPPSSLFTHPPALLPPSLPPTATSLLPTRKQSHTPPLSRQPPHTYRRVPYPYA
ncbi:hypothetical protein PAXRUDRAFT_350537 [Paxillus rubicundulus Ve08.2h10]|uniref:Uncharacterized protein n=1 Tax=Paxillus rubicundulus Ve08.2h10 TaxID=930991 RepID=A0A0D0C4E0_9AGAM|nr:hypothetical protein PAXRUDRAFT_350537 [Paxillus rubicundulus Ve08.2h10]